jgi:UDP:flavonoid glycosyltransferase YjiC (YdhE family)
MGSKIVLNTFGSLGDLNPYLGIALGLKSMGHAPTIATAEVYREYVEGAGVGFHPVRPDVSIDDRETIRRVMDPKGGMEFLLRGVLLSQLRESYLDLEEALRGASLLITHPLSFAGHVAAEKLRIPWVSTVLAPISFLSACDPPILPELAFMQHLRVLGPAVNRWIYDRLPKLYTRKWVDPVRRLREELGLPAGRNPLFEGQHSPGLVLALFSRAIAAPQKDWPDRTVVTGFVTYDRDLHGEGIVEELDRFLGAGPPPLVFTLGSSAVFEAGNFYRESAKAASALGKRALLLVGKDLAQDIPHPLPEGVAAFPYAPYSAVFPRCAALVHSCGIGTIAQAMRAGKPSLALSYGFDQPDNAARITKLGIGKVVPAKKYTADLAASLLQEILENPAFADRASSLGDRVRAEDGAGTACMAIERILKGVRGDASAMSLSEPLGETCCQRSEGNGKSRQGLGLDAFWYTTKACLGDRAGNTGDGIAVAAQRNRPPDDTCA